jgi:uncharacterized protein YjbI with pentapeptide repeats
MREGRHTSKARLLALLSMPALLIVAARALSGMRGRSRAATATTSVTVHPQPPREQLSEPTRPPLKTRREVGIGSVMGAMAIAIMLFVFALLNLRLPAPVIVPLVIAAGLGLAIGGGIIWQTERNVQGSKSNLGSALLAGAVVTFTVFGFQMYLDRQRSIIEGQRFALEQNRQAFAIAAEQAGQRYAVASQRQAQGYTIDIERRRVTLEQQARKAAELQTLRLIVGLQKDLTGINLHSLRLSDFYMRDKNLTDADLGEADLRGVDLRGTRLLGANLERAIANSATQWPRGFNPRAAGVIMR